MTERFFEDFHPGFRFRTRGVTFTEADIVDFAFRYDPQPFHIDAVAARDSIFGGLVASGFHTLARGFRMVIQEGVFAACNLGSPGFDDLKWLAPVRPGDTIRVEGEVLEARPSRSKPDRGSLRVHYRFLNQDGEAVLSMTAVQILKRRASPEQPR